jgi:hypothetical protein
MEHPSATILERSPVSLGLCETSLDVESVNRNSITKEELQALVEMLCHRATYDEQSQEFFALTSKKATLEAADKTDTEAYDQVTEQVDTLNAELTDTLDHLAAEDAFAEIGDD